MAPIDFKYLEVCLFAPVNLVRDSLLAHAEESE